MALPQTCPGTSVTVANWSSCYSFISENPLVAKLQYGLKITFIFILILFIDSVNRVYRVQVELAAVADSGNAAYVPNLSPSTEYLSIAPPDNTCRELQSHIANHCMPHQQRSNHGP